MGRVICESGNPELIQSGFASGNAQLTEAELKTHVESLGYSYETFRLEYYSVISDYVNYDRTRRFVDKYKINFVM
jgi:hypothetical protein